MYYFLKYYSIFDPNNNDYNPSSFKSAGKTKKIDGKP